MSTLATIGNPAGRLCGHLAAGVAQYLAACEGLDTPARAGDVLWPGGQSDFEMAYDALERLGLLAPRERADGTAQVFVMDAAAFPDFLAAQAVPDVETAADLREAFVRVACGYGGLSDELAPFMPPPLWMPAMRRLAAAGYATCAGSLFTWTDGMAPAMRAAGAWDAENRSLKSLAAVARAVEAEMAWRAMPDTLRRSLRAQRIDFISFVKIVVLSWRDGRWTDFHRDQPVSLSADHHALARTLMRRALEEA